MDRLPAKLEAILLSQIIVKTGRSIHNDIRKIFLDFGLPDDPTNRNCIELSSLCRKAGFVRPGMRTTLQALTAVVLNRQLPKPQDIRLGKWDARRLSPAQVAYAAADAWASLRIFQNVDALVRPGDTIEAPVPGLFVEIRLNANSKTVIARGHIVDHPDDRLNDVRIIPGKHCVVRVSLVEVPGAVAFKHRCSLSSFGPAPFLLVVPLPHLRNSIPVSVAEALRRLSEQEHSVDDGSLAALAESLRLTRMDDDDNGTQLNDIIAASNEVPSLPSPTDSDGLGDFTADLTQVVRWVLDDPYHVMARIRVSRMHGAALQFAWAFRDAIFVPDPLAKEQVSRVLLAKGTTFDKQLASNPAWVHARVPRRIPTPQKLYPILRQLFAEYEDLLDARTKKPLFDSTAKEKKEGVLKDVLEGYLSDPPGIELYIAVGKDKDGLVVYRCLRGTNSVEGGVHQNIIRMFQSFNASPQLAVGLLSEYVLRHNLVVMHRNTTGKLFRDHFDVWLTSEILTLYDALDVARPERYRTRMNLNDFADTDEQMFIAPLPHEMRERYGIQAWDEAKVTSGSQLDWLAKRQGCAVPATPVHTHEERALFRRIIPNADASFNSQECARRYNAHVSTDGGMGKTLFVGINARFPSLVA